MSILHYARKLLAGCLLRAQGDLNAALSAYCASLEIRERLAAANLRHIGWQFDVGTSHERIGFVLQQQGNLAAAFGAFNFKQDLIERLAAADPSNAVWQRELWVSCWHVANLTEQMGGEARAWWRRAYEVLSAMKQRGLFVSADDEQFLAQLEQKIRG